MDRIANSSCGMQSPITYETRAAKPSRIEESSTIRGKLTGPADGVSGMPRVWTSISSMIQSSTSVDTADNRADVNGPVFSTMGK